MLSKKYKFLFIHIPRTGGTSVEYALKDYSEDTVDFNMAGRVYPSGLAPKSGLPTDGGWYKHSPARQFKEALGDEYDDYYKFVIVRHPIEKLRSVCRFNGSKPKNLCSQYDGTKDFKSRWLLFQTDYFCDEEGRIIVDDIFHTETLEEDWKIICEKIGIDHVELTHLNKKKNDSKTYKDLLSTEDIAYFEEFFDSEMETLGYKK